VQPTKIFFSKKQQNNNLISKYFYSFKNGNGSFYFHFKKNTNILFEICGFLEILN